MITPDFLTIIEAARILRIGRTVAYEQAARYEATGGAEGLPVMRVGRQMRVPRALLEQRAGVSLTSAVIDLRREEDVTTPAVARDPQRAVSHVDGDQAAFSFGS